MKQSIEDKIIEGLEEFSRDLESGKKISEKYTCRTIVLNLKPRPYKPAMVKKTRALLGASQAVFAIFLGVSVKTVQAWENGFINPSKMACRFMDEIQRDPEFYLNRLKNMATAK
jgi:putative transcriptional regulator